MTPFYTNLIVPGLLLFLLVASQIRLRFSLRLTYPLAAKPRQPFNKADWPFCLRLAKFLLKRLHLKQLHCQLQLAGRPDVCAMAGGCLLAALHGLAAAANCPSPDLHLQLVANEKMPLENSFSGEIFLKISLPLWVIITAALRLAAYFGHRRLKLSSSDKI
jgi:hypothetical protein